jgi:hypothetical protein
MIGPGWDARRKLAGQQEARPVALACSRASTFAKARQRPVILVLLLRDLTKGEPVANLARELSIARRRLHTLRLWLGAHLMAFSRIVPGGEEGL